MEKNAQWVADTHVRYGWPLVWLSPADLRAGRKGYTSHGNWYHGRGGPAYRSDPGAGYPHDVVLKRAHEIVNQGGITVSEADRIIKFMQDYLGPGLSDTKDVRQQITGGRDLIPGDLAASYPGWDLDRLVATAREKEFRGLTLVEMIAVLLGGSEDDAAAARAAARGEEQA